MRQINFTVNITPPVDIKRDHVVYMPVMGQKLQIGLPSEAKVRVFDEEGNIQDTKVVSPERGPVGKDNTIKPIPFVFKGERYYHVRKDSDLDIYLRQLGQCVSSDEYLIDQDYTLKEIESGVRVDPFRGKYIRFDPDLKYETDLRNIGGAMKAYSYIAQKVGTINLEDGTINWAKKGSPKETLKAIFELVEQKDAIKDEHMFAVVMSSASDQVKAEKIVSMFENEEKAKIDAEIGRMARAGVIQKSGFNWKYGDKSLGTDKALFALFTSQDTDNKNTIAGLRLELEEKLKSKKK